MPASPQESLAMVKIIAKYLPWNKAKNLSVDLYNEVGKKTDNSSLRTTLYDLADYISEDPLGLFSK
jgi:hypothetical protein